MAKLRPPNVEIVYWQINTFSTRSVNTTHTDAQKCDYVKWYNARKHIQTDSCVYAYNAADGDDDNDHTRFDIIIKETNAQCIDISGHVGYSLSLSLADKHIHYRMCFLLSMRKKMNGTRLHSVILSLSVRVCVCLMQYWACIYLYIHTFHTSHTKNRLLVCQFTGNEPKTSNWIFTIWHGMYYCVWCF